MATGSIKGSLQIVPMLPERTDEGPGDLPSRHRRG
jgi:hypothetical protein